MQWWTEQVFRLGMLSSGLDIARPTERPFYGSIRSLDKKTALAFALADNALICTDILFREVLRW